MPPKKKLKPGEGERCLPASFFKQTENVSPSVNTSTSTEQSTVDTDQPQPGPSGENRPSTTAIREETPTDEKKKKKICPYMDNDISLGQS